MSSPIKVFIDTEFTNFMDSRLISLGAITEDGENEFYVEITDYNKQSSSEFVKENIEPLLDHAKYGKTFIQASASFGCWLEELGPVDLCPDYIADWELVVDLLDGDIPINVASFPIMLLDHINVLSLQNPSLSVHSGRQVFDDEVNAYFLRHNKIRHHALDDAKANRAGYLAFLKWLNNVDNCQAYVGPSPQPFEWPDM